MWVEFVDGSLALRGFSPGTPVFPSPQKPTLPNAKSIWNARTRLNEFTWTPKCLVGKKAIYTYIYNPLSPGTPEKKKSNPAKLACSEQIQWAEIMAMEITEKPTDFVSYVFAAVAVAVDFLFLPNINTCLVTVKGWYPHLGHDFGNALLYSKSVVPNYFFIWERGI